jgi:serine/threonine protein kinase
MNPDPSREDTLSAAADMDATIRMDVRATLPVGMEQPGDMIGRYKLIEPLGEGGFGSVWRAEQSEPIRREVALKVIKPGMDSREIIARFEAERQALALMDHPNIAGVLDAGTTDSGRPVFRHGTGEGRSHHRLLRHTRSSPSASVWSCSFLSARPCSTRIRKPSCIAI